MNILGPALDTPDWMDSAGRYYSRIEGRRDSVRMMRPPTWRRVRRESGNRVMIIVLNGPLGIGKSTLAEALTERIDSCVMLDGDRLVAVNPPAANELDHLHSTIAVLVEHHRRFGYRHFVIDHIWRSRAELDDLHARLTAIDTNAEIRCFLLTLPAEENLRRIERRQYARAIDERHFARRTLTPGPLGLSFVPERRERIQSCGVACG